MILVDTDQRDGIVADTVRQFHGQGDIPLPAALRNYADAIDMGSMSVNSNGTSQALRSYAHQLEIGEISEENFMRMLQAEP